MRRLLQMIVVASGFFILACTACRHDHGLYVSPPNNADSASNNPPGPAAGAWIVSLFHDNGTDMTTHLDGYSFCFNSNGTMTVNTGAGTIGGTWRTMVEGGREKLIIAMVNADPMLAELNESWLIINNGATEVELSKTGYHPRKLQFTRQ